MTPAQFLEFIVSVSIQATIIVGATYWLCRIVEAPSLQCRLWSSCHIVVLIVMISGIVFPHLRAPGPWQFLPAPAIEKAVTTETFLGHVALIAWMGGAFVSLVLLVREWICAFRFLKSCRIANEHEKSLVAQTEISHFGENSARKNRPVQFLVSNHLSSPFCCQWHKPHLVIPEFLLELPHEELKFVARHELEHLDCGHPLQLFIERVVATVFWFHPAIWWASRQSSLAREYACDDAAVLERREIVSYLKILLAIAERGLSEEAEGATLFFGRGASIVALRGRRLLNKAEKTPPKNPQGRMPWAQAVLAMLALTSSFIWVPLDALASSQTNWSPWPQWSASVLRAFDIPARDFEPYEVRTRIHEISTTAPPKGRQEHRSFTPKSSR